MRSVALLLPGVLLLANCGGGSGPPVELVVPRGFTGTVWLLLDPGGQDIPLVDGRYRIAVPPRRRAPGPVAPAAGAVALVLRPLQRRHPDPSGPRRRRGRAGGGRGPRRGSGGDPPRRPGVPVSHVFRWDRRAAGGDAGNSGHPRRRQVVVAGPTETDNRGGRPEPTAAADPAAG